MKKIFSYIILFLLPFGATSQNDNCINAIPLCSNPSFTFFSNSGPGSIIDFSVPAQSNISNPSPNPNPPNSGCLLSGELNPQWLLITVGNAGTLEFVFGAGNSANPQVGLYDWIMWPYSPTTCADIFNNTLPPIRCNWNGTSVGGTGIASATNIAAVGGSSVNFEAPIQVNQCQQFIICISNYSGVNSLVSFQSLGSASLSCNPNCNPNYAICAGASASIVPVNFASLSNPSYSMQPGGLTSVTGTFVVSPLVTTSYTTFITGINANNAVQTITSVSTVTVNAQPSAIPTTTQTTCTNTVSAFNLGLSFIPSTPAPSYSITWAPTPNGITNSTQASYSGSITPGIYNATISTGGGCNAITSFTINNQPLPPVFTINPLGSTFTITCANPTITINTSDPSLTYTWVNGISAPVNGSVASLTNFDVGTWSITAMDPVSMCLKTHTFNLAINTTAPTSTLTPNYQLITCTNSAIQTVTTTSTPSINIEHKYLFSNGLVVVTNATTGIVTPPPGTHTFVLTDLTNGCSTIKNFSVATSSGFPTFTLTSPIQNYSIGCVPKHTVDINIAGTESDPPGLALTYTILPPGTGTYNTGGQSAYSFSVPGQYTVVVRDVASGCETKSPFSVIQNTFTPNIAVAVQNPTLTCTTPSVILMGSSTNPSAGYRWLFTGGAGVLPGPTFTVNTILPPRITPIATYTFEVTDNNNACKSVSFVPIWENIYPPVARITGPNGNTISDAVSCKIPTLTLSNASTWGSPTGAFPTPLGVVAILWSGPSPQIPKQNSASYLAGQPGTYSMTAQDPNNGCTTNTIFTVIDNKDFPIVNNPVAASNATLDCSPNANNSATLTAFITSTVPVKYTWSNTLGDIKTATLSANSSTAFVLVNKPGDYRITVLNEQNGCITISSGKVVLGNLYAAFNSDIVEGFAPLTVNFSNNSQSSLNSLSITSVWNFGNSYTATTSSSILNISTVYNQAGTYTVTLFTNKGECFDTTYTVIHVELPSKLEIPNVFSPNGDGVNDLFFLRTSNLTSVKATIYDRWGNLVYEVESSSGNIEWDGKTQYGKEAAAGTYFYIITASGKDLEPYDTKGTISLFR